MLYPMTSPRRVDNEVTRKAVQGLLRLEPHRRLRRIRRLEKYGALLRQMEMEGRLTAEQHDHGVQRLQAAVLDRFTDDAASACLRDALNHRPDDGDSPVVEVQVMELAEVLVGTIADVRTAIDALLEGLLEDGAHEALDALFDLEARGKARKGVLVALKRARARVNEQQVQVVGE